MLHYSAAPPQNGTVPLKELHNVWNIPLDVPSIIFNSMLMCRVLFRSASSLPQAANVRGEVASCKYHRHASSAGSISQQHLVHQLIALGLEHHSPVSIVDTRRLRFLCAQYSLCHHRCAGSTGRNTQHERSTHLHHVPLGTTYIDDDFIVM